MPELPEVESIVRTLRPHLRGRMLALVTVHNTQVIRSDVGCLVLGLRRSPVTDVARSGKRVVIQFKNGAKLVVALGMTGRLTVVSVDEPVLKHTHLRARIAGTNKELRFRDPRRFGGIWLLGDGQAMVGPRLGPIGPDALAIRLPVFRRLLTRHRQIKALLLDQRAIAGLGNIYCDEGLHRARIHPRTPASQLSADQVKSLLQQIRTVLRAAIRDGGSTFMDYRNADGRPGGFQRKHQVYGREGEACRTCKATIVRIQAAGRSSHICPNCQRSPECIPRG